MFVPLLALEALLAAPRDPFAFFQPSVAISTEDRRQLDRGEPPVANAGAIE